MTRTLLAAAAAALLSTTPAEAGPITWSYNTQLVSNPDMGGGDFDPGRVTPASGAATGAGTVPLFGLSPYTYGNPLLPGDFTALFTVADAASGSSHTFSFDGQASYSWNPQFPRPDEAINLFPFGVPQQATIGNHEYTVEYTGGHTQGDGVYVLTAAVTVANSPEPATALLAGLGLICFAGLRPIRKWRGCVTCDTCRPGRP